MIGVLVALALVAPQVQTGPQAVTVQLITPEEHAEQTAYTRPASQGDWRLLSSPSAAPMAVDVANVLSEGAQRTVWVARASTGEGFPPGSYFLMRLRLDCNAETVQLRWQAVYRASGDNIFGQSVEQEPDRYSGVSSAAEIATMVCDGQAPTGQSFPTDEAFAASSLSH